MCSTFVSGVIFSWMRFKHVVSRRQLKRLKHQSIHQYTIHRWYTNVFVCVCVRTMQAVLQMSAGGPYSAPIRTSRALYCLVWMSSVKCLCWTRERQREELSDWFILTLQREELSDWLILTLQREWLYYREEEEEMMKVSHHPACISQISDLHSQSVGVLRIQRTEDEVRRTEHWKTQKIHQILLILYILYTVCTVHTVVYLCVCIYCVLYIL